MGGNVVTVDRLLQNFVQPSASISGSTESIVGLTALKMTEEQMQWKKDTELKNANALKKDQTGNAVPTDDDTKKPKLTTAEIRAMKKAHLERAARDLTGDTAD